MSLLILTVASLALAGTLLHAHLKQRRLSSLSWNDLLAKLGTVPTDGITAVALHVQEAASAYYLMRARLLALYETSHAGRYPALSAVL